MEAFNKRENVNGRVNMSGYLNEQDKKNPKNEALSSSSYNK